MRKTILYISVILALGAIPAVTTALPFAIHARTTRGTVVVGTGKRASVPKRSKSPVNIPISSGRFRPGWTEENCYDMITCDYWRGYVRISFSCGNSFARIIVRTPGNGEGELYRVGTLQPAVVRTGVLPGDYSIQIVTADGSECEFLFNIPE